MLATGPRSSSRTLSTSSSARLDRWGGGRWRWWRSSCCRCSSSIRLLTFSCSSSSSSPGCARAVHRQSAGHFSCAQRGTHSANCAEDCSWRRRPCDQQRQFPQSRGSNPFAPESVRPLSGEHSYCATDFVEFHSAVLGQGGDMPVVATTGAVLVVVWEVVDMPVYVQRQVLSFQQNFHIFYVNVDSDPEAEFALENLNIISVSFVLCSCVSQRAFGRILSFTREGSLGCPREVRT